MMGNVFAFCDNCNVIIPLPITTPKLISPGGVNVPCPSCGGMADIPAGVYDFANGVINLLNPKKMPLARILEIQFALKSIHKMDVNYNEVCEIIDKVAPELSSLKDILPKTREELYQFLSVLFTLLALIVSLTQLGKEVNYSTVINNTTNNTHIGNQQNVINNHSNSNNQINTTKTEKPKPIVNTKKVGRNKPCPCMSGKKYKECCGKK